MKMIKIQKLIDETIKSIWLNEIKADREKRWLLKEDSLKSAFYFHLRNKLGHVFDMYNIRIYTEFTDEKFSGSHKRPDMVIALNSGKEEYDYLGNEIKDCLAVIEFKHKCGKSAGNDIYKDYEKLKYYVEELKIECPLYMVTMWEYIYAPKEHLARKNAKWAKGRLTELYASWDENYEMKFHEPYPH